MKKAKSTFKEMLNLCYEEDCPELHRELLSLENEVKKEKNKIRYQTAMNEIINSIPLFADDFPSETFYQLEIIYEEYLENE
jgi:hypothetical protein